MALEELFSDPEVDPIGRRLDERQIGGGSTFWKSKRLCDVSFSILLLPALFAFAILLLAVNPWFNPGPLFFRQERMGRGQKPFSVFKFRSMVPNVSVNRSAHDPIEVDRITPVGLLIRETRIDELPQVLNVLRGEMSLIGPRPDTYEHAIEFVTLVPGYRDRHIVRPGISGLAQVTLGYAEGLDATKAKTMADLAYIRNASAALDLSIFWLTLVTVFRRAGA